MEERIRHFMYQIDSTTIKNLSVFVSCCFYWLWVVWCLDTIKGIPGKIFAIVPALLLLYFLTGCSYPSQQQTQVVELTTQTVIAEVTICQEAGMSPTLLKNVYGGISKVVCEMDESTGSELRLRRSVLGE